MSMDILIREPDGVRRAGALVIGRGVPLATTAGGLPELLWNTVVGETQLMPSGGDDTQAIQGALSGYGRVRLGPGDFTVSSTLQVGTGQAIVGCGPGRTTVRATHAQPGMIVLSGSGTAVEDLTLIGPVPWGSPGQAGVRTTSATDVRLRRLHLENLDHGLLLGGIARAEISGITIHRVGSVAITVQSGSQVGIADVHLDSPALIRGLLLTAVDGLLCTGITVRQAEQGILAEGSALAFDSIRLLYCELGMQVFGARGVAISGVHIADGFGVGVAILDSTGVALGGCATLRGGSTTLSIRNSAGVTANGVHSDMTGAGAGAPPHVVVDGGSTEVMISGIRVTNPTTPPQYEVDVAAAGGRVLFAQHNFDPARINSGGNFAAV